MTRHIWLPRFPSSHPGLSTPAPASASRLPPRVPAPRLPCRPAPSRADARALPAATM